MEPRKTHQVERIKKEVTFSKRRSRFLKEAHELAVLCDAQVAAIVFSSSGKMYDFSSPRSSSMRKVVERYAKSTKDEKITEEIIGLHFDKHLQKQELMSTQNNRCVDMKMPNELEQLLSLQNNRCVDIKKLNELEQQLSMYLCSIRELKDRKLLEQIEEMQGKACKLMEEKQGCNVMEETQGLQEMVAESEQESSISSCGDVVDAAGSQY